MKKRKNVMILWKEFNPMPERAIKDDFKDTPSPFSKKNIEYLNNGDLVVASTSCSIDIISEKK